MEKKMSDASSTDPEKEEEKILGESRALADLVT
jgi:hypothetical protein